VKKPVAENPLRRIKDEIRADAEAARARFAQAASRPKPVVPGTIAVLKQARDEYSIDELAKLHYTKFLDQAFAVLLRRPPDSTAYNLQVQLLEEGRSKLEILGNLRYSAEGRAIGVRVPWLLPRYLLAKATRIPVLGYVFEWIMCIGGLPLLLRHQRGADAYHAARNLELGQELGQELAKLTDEASALRGEIVRLDVDRASVSTRLQQLSDRFAPVHSELGQAFNEIRDLRHLVLSMNHWLASLRQNLSSLEAAEAEQIRKTDAFYADISSEILAADPARPARLRLWAEMFATLLPASADVLDVGSGLDWLQALSRQGVKVTGVDPNHESGQRARNAGITSVVADPPVVLARMADGSVDGVTILDIAPLLRSLPAYSLLEILRRVLRPGGRLLFGFGQEPASIADRLEGRASAIADCGLVQHALQTSGFVEVRRSEAADGAVCVIARQPG
jgi:SAM-dependent methyltransferase